jgi:hypothetical protein
VLTCLFLNVMLMGVGILYSSRVICGLMAGGIDGGIIATILVYTLGEKLRAGATGLLGGYGFHEISSGFDLATKYAKWLHIHSEKLLAALLGPEGPLHDDVQMEAVWMACTAAFVIMTVLFIELILAARSEAGDENARNSTRDALPT